MKKLLLPLFTLACFALQAQDFSVEVLDTTITGSPSEGTFYGDIDLYNNLGSTFTMHWERIAESVPAGWTTSNCDPEACRAVGVTSASFTLPTNTSYLNTHFYPDGVAGSGYMRVKLWLDSDTSENVVLTYYGVAGSVGIDDLDASEIQVFPTIANSTLNIMLPHPGEPIQAHIYGLNGQHAQSFQLASGNASSVDVSDLKAGVYFISFNLGGSKVLTKKFVKM